MTRICHAPRYAKDSGNSFADVITGWTVQPDQSTAGASTYVEGNSNFRASDLQVSKFGANFAMVHKMGLVRLNPTTKSVATTLTYTYDKADGGYTSSTSGTSTITASNDFTGNKPYTVNNQYWHIVKATGAETNTAMSFTCNPNQKDFWSEKSSGTNVGYGKYRLIDIQSDRTAANFVALFSCVGKCQEIALPWYGNYKMECWGAKGGDADYCNGGIGGYTTGIITLNKNKNLYVFVGGGVEKKNVTGGFNGGGKGYIGPTQFGYGGGGSTDIRVFANDDRDWNNTTSLVSRIMVAAGGGGAGFFNSEANSGIGGAGGGLEGFDGTANEGSAWPGTPHSGLKGTQTAGGQLGEGYTSGEKATHALINQFHLNDGGLGYGGWNGASVADNGSGAQTNFGAPGGGAGYYGGGGANRGHGGGGGGSSFISGMTGCIALEGYRGDNNTILKYDNEQYIFGDASTIGGSSASLPSNPGYVSSTVTNGYAKITSQ